MISPMIKSPFKFILNFLFAYRLKKINDNDDRDVKKAEAEHFIASVYIKRNFGEFYFPALMDNNNVDELVKNIIIIIRESDNKVIIHS